MSEKGQNYDSYLKINFDKSPKKIKEITLSNKKCFTSAKKRNNEINIIPIKIALTPRIKENITETKYSPHKTEINYDTNKSNNNINRIPFISCKKIIMTPKIENNSSLTSSSNVIIKNFNYSNVYNINIDKDKEKNIKTYQIFTYNKPKTTSNYNMKSFNDNFKIIKEKEKTMFFARFNSEKNIFKKSNKKIIISKTEINSFDSQKNNDNNRHIYNNNDNNKNIIKTYYYKNDIIKPDKNNENNDIYYIPFNPNDINIFIEKINSIIISYTKRKEKDIYINCYEFFTFYNQSSLKNIFQNFFNQNNKIILNSCINLCLFSIIIIYHLSSENLIANNIINILKQILLLIKINFSLIIKQIQLKYRKNFYLEQNETFLKSKNFNNIIKEEDIVKIIFDNSKIMTNDIKIIMNYYKSINILLYNDFITKFNNISVHNEDDFINYFFNNISRININKSLERHRFLKKNNTNSHSHINIFSRKKKNIFENLSIKKSTNSINNSINNNNKVIIKKLVKRQKKEITPLLNYKIDIPYIKSKSLKKYTLILNIEQTIAYRNNSDGNIILRNGLFSFLSTVKPFYELISFSLEDKNVSEAILNLIEQDKIYFDYKLYKEHGVLFENNLIKDISFIGRDLNKIIIIDIEDNYFLTNKENLIKIAPFNETTKSDDKLFELKRILKKIYFNNYDDIRIGIKEYENDIKSKISI